MPLRGLGLGRVWCSGPARAAGSSSSPSRESRVRCSTLCAPCTGTGGGGGQRPLVIQDPASGLAVHVIPTTPISLRGTHVLSERSTKYSYKALITAGPTAHR
jgi:hypothetical protein